MYWFHCSWSTGWVIWVPVMIYFCYLLFQAEDHDLVFHAKLAGWLKEINWDPAMIQNSEIMTSHHFVTPTKTQSRLPSITRRFNPPEIYLYVNIYIYESVNAWTAVLLLAGVRLSEMSKRRGSENSEAKHDSKLATKFDQHFIDKQSKNPPKPPPFESPVLPWQFALQRICRTCSH